MITFLLVNYFASVALNLQNVYLMNSILRVLYILIYLNNNSLLKCGQGYHLYKKTMFNTFSDTATQFKLLPKHLPTIKAHIFLTFDDGPQNGTVECLETCKKLGVKASFFIVGNHANNKNFIETATTIKKSYPQFLIANHSTTHANDKYIDFYNHPKKAAKDFYLMQQTFALPFKIVRLPGNNAWVYNHKMKASNLVKPVCLLLKKNGYKIVGWDIECSFNHKSYNPIQSPSHFVQQVESALDKNNLNTKNKIVILMHDRMFGRRSCDWLFQFITILKRNPNYVFETIDHYWEKDDTPVSAY